MEQILAGLKLMLAGMGAVFLFLVIMIGWIKLSAVVSARFAHLLPEKAAAMPRRPAAAGAGAAPGANAGLIAAITAAVHRYRRERRL